MLRFADLERDASWIETVRQSADRLLVDDPAAAQAMIQRWFAGAAQYLGA
jgi:ATP-dependent DNA helicase RecG